MTPAWASQGNRLSVFCAYLTGAANSVARRTKVLMPTTRPQPSTSGPPLLPWLMSAVCGITTSPPGSVVKVLIVPRVSTISGGVERRPWRSSCMPRSISTTTAG